MESQKIFLSRNNSDIIASSSSIKLESEQKDPNIPQLTLEKSPNEQTRDQIVNIQPIKINLFDHLSSL
jgi:hypothetical protein